MESKATYLSVHPIGDSDPKRLPVPDVDRAAPYYETRLGFIVEARIDTPVKSVILARDAVQIGLAETGADPGQASCYIEVSDVDLARQELSVIGLHPTEIRTDQHDGNSYRVFFIKDEDGICYCLGQKG